MTPIFLRRTSPNLSVYSRLAEDHPSNFDQVAKAIASDEQNWAVGAE